MQEVVRRCDKLIGTKGNRCGERVPDDSPTLFSFQGVAYSSDLCEKHQSELEAVLAPFLTTAEPTTTKSGHAVRKAMRGKKGAFTTKDVREWLTANGREVAGSGRLPNALIEEYKEAQKV